MRAGFRVDAQTQAGEAKAVLQQAWDTQPGLIMDNDRMRIRF